MRARVNDLHRLDLLNAPGILDQVTADLKKLPLGRLGFCSQRDSLSPLCKSLQRCVVLVHALMTTPVVLVVVVVAGWSTMQGLASGLCGPGLAVGAVDGDPYMARPYIVLCEHQRRADGLWLSSGELPWLGGSSMGCEF